jgi:hypothetical protein
MCGTMKLVSGRNPIDFLVMPSKFGSLEMRTIMHCMARSADVVAYAALVQAVGLLVIKHSRH